MREGGWEGGRDGGREGGKEGFHLKMIKPRPEFSLWCGTTQFFSMQQLEKNVLLPGEEEYVKYFN